MRLEGNCVFIHLGITWEPVNPGHLTINPPFPPRSVRVESELGVQEAGAGIREVTDAGQRYVAFGKIMLAWNSNVTISRYPKCDIYSNIHCNNHFVLVKIMLQLFLAISP